MVDVMIKDALKAVEDYLGTIQRCLEMTGVEEVMATETGEIVLTNELSRVRGILSCFIDNEAFELR